jgi:hypothetical protein
LCLGPWLQGVGVFGKVAVGQFGEQIAQTGAGFDAARLAGAGQAGKRARFRPPSSSPAKSALRRFMAGLWTALSTRVVHVAAAIIAE